MNEKLIPIGKYLKEFNNYFPYDLKEEIIYRSAGLEKHISFELVKVLSNNIQLGIKLDHNNNYLYVATLRTITDSKLQHCIQNGRLRKFDKTIDISYNQTT